MPIHIGKKIKVAVEAKGLSQQQFGALIGKDENAVSKIYRQPHILIDLLVTISTVLKTDFIQLYYEEEGMERFREEDEIFKLQQKSKELDKQIEEKERLLRQLKSEN